MLLRKLKKHLVLLLSIATCSVAFLVFLVLLSQNSTQEAHAEGYNSDQIIIAVNLQRQEQGLPPLITNDKLTKAAEAKAKDMADKSYFSHISPIDGKKWSDFIKESGYKYDVAGENLANGFDTTDTMVTAWIDSPSHRENILNPSVDETGLAISYGKLKKNPTIFVVQVFGKREVTPQASNLITKISDKPANLSKDSIGRLLEQRKE